MKKYYVTYQILCKYTVAVEARSKEEAIKKVKENGEEVEPIDIKVGKSVYKNLTVKKHKKFRNGE